MQKQLLLLMLLLVLVGPVLAMGTRPHLPGIVDLQAAISADLNKMDADLALAAKELSAAGLQGAATNKILQRLYDDHRAAVDAATIDLSGTLLTIQPRRYKNSEGRSVSDQAHFIAVKNSRQPTLSKLFRAVEGFLAVSLIQPVNSDRGEPLGYVSIVFKPDALIGNIIRPYVSNVPSVEVLAIQADGQIIYDKDLRQVGKMTFSDPDYQAYPDLLDLARKIVRRHRGTGTYTFPAGPGPAPVKKSTEWTTISLHGLDWRLIISKVL